MRLSRAPLEPQENDFMKSLMGGSGSGGGDEPEPASGGSGSGSGSGSDSDDGPAFLG